jgi:hypothetical protein
VREAGMSGKALSLASGRGEEEVFSLESLSLFLSKKLL